MDIMFSLHPAAVLHSPDAYRDYAWDMLRFAQGPSQWKPPQAVVVTEPEQLLEFLNPEGINAVDIETTGFYPMWDRILSIGVSGYIDRAAIIPMEGISSEMLETLRRTAKEYSWVGHNSLAFDTVFLKHSLQIEYPRMEDTMLLHYVLDERPRGHSLKMVARALLGADDYAQNVRSYVVEEGTTFEDIPREELYRYQACDVCCTLGIYQKMLPQISLEQRKLLEEILIPGAKMLGDIRLYGICIDLEHLASLEKQLSEDYQLLEEEVATRAERPLNIRSPKQLSRYFFVDQGISAWGVPRTKTGEISTNEEALDVITPRDDSGVAPAVLEARAMHKLLSTYVRGIRKRLSPDGKLRPSLHITGTSTGRLASTNPNIQNIPKHSEQARELRKAFVASPGFLFVEGDYSQLEFRVAAYYSQDEALIRAFKSGHDFHTSVASEVFHKPPEQISREERHRAKFVNFGILYGRQAQSLAEGELNCSVEQAQAFLNHFLAQFPKMDRMLKDNERRAVEEHYVSTPFGRRRRFPLILDKNRMAIRREARNMPIQSLASDICLRAAIRIHQTFSPQDLRVLFLIHDSIMMEVREDLVEALVPEIRRIMEDTGLDTPIPFPVDITISKRWAQEDH